MLWRERVHGSIGAPVTATGQKAGDLVRLDAVYDELSLVWQSPVALDRLFTYTVMILQGVRLGEKLYYQFGYLSLCCKASAVAKYCQARDQPVTVVCSVVAQTVM
jgi:hypothetical protein